MWIFPWETTSGFISVFSASSFVSGYMLSSSLRRLLYSDPAIDSRPALLFCVCREEYRNWIWCRARVDNGIAMLGLVLLVSAHFALCSFLLLPYTAHCLVLSGTCYASVYGVVEFQVFLRKKVDYGS